MTIAALRFVLRPKRLALLIEIAFLIAVLHLAYRLIERVWPNPSDEAVYPHVPTWLEAHRRSQ